MVNRQTRRSLLRFRPLLALFAVFSLFAVLPVGLDIRSGGAGPETAEAGILPAAQQISAGWYHTCAVTNLGGVKCWGYNSDGQLGNGTFADSDTPVDVQGLTSGVEAVAAGGFHTCALTTAHGVKCWGDGFDGQVGGANPEDYETPIDVPGLTSGVRQIVAGNYHTCALMEAGEVKCFGDDDQGQIGDGTTGDPTCVCRPDPTDVAGLGASVEFLSAGGEFTCALMNGNVVKCWGDDYNGELGDGSTVKETDCVCKTTPVQVTGLSASTIEAGAHHACATTLEGHAVCWGQNNNGQLGNGNTTDSSTPVNVSDLSGDIGELAAGGSHTCAIIVDGGIACWGANYAGQLGNGSAFESHIPAAVTLPTTEAADVTAGMSHTCAITTGGLVCWGDDSTGENGDNTSGDESCSCNQLPTGVIGLAPDAPAEQPSIEASPADETFRDTDIVEAGRGGMRDNGVGSISLSGVSGTITKAYLFWQTIEGHAAESQGINSIQGTDQGQGTHVSFNGTPVVGTNIGRASANCWSYEESDAYRADVTSLVAGNGNYSLSGFEKQGVAVNGASLVVFFDDGNPDNNSDVVLFEGDDSTTGSSFDADGWNLLMSGFTYTGGDASLTLHIGDGQTYEDGALTVNGHQVRGSGQNWDGDSVPGDPTSSAANQGGLWDIKTYNIGSSLSSGDATLSVRTPYNFSTDDCASLVVAALSLPVGSAVPPLTWGDNNCSGSIDGADGLPVLDHLAELDVFSVNGFPQCPPVGQQLGFPGGPLWADVNCSGGITAQDMIAVLQYVAGLHYDHSQDCALIGDVIGPL